MHKITKEHFDYFKKRCEYWKDLFGLKNWHILCIRTEIDADYFASLEADVNGYCATIYLNKRRHWPVTRDSLDYSALHEIVHVVLARYRSTAKARFVNEAELHEAEEEAVRTICSVIRG